VFKEASDEELMDRYCAGDPAAFDEMFRRFAPRLVRFLRPMVGLTHAHDVAQVALLKMHENRHRYRVGARVASWLFTIARNTALDHIKSAPSRREVSDDKADAPTEHVQADVLKEQRVRGAVASLPDDQRDVILLHWFGGLTFAEVAGVVGASNAAVRLRAFRAYETLRGSLQEVQ
jgi:RNA polymerase sigma-70 factor (ECF subfamily)